LGAGMLNFPQAFDSAGGIAVAMTVQVVIVLLATISLLILAWCSDVRGTATYQETVGALCGSIGKHTCSVFTILYCYAACIALLVVVGDQTDRVFYDKYGDDFCRTWYLDRKFIVTVASLFTILPFCYAKTIDVLKYASSLATVGVFYLVFLIVYEYFTSNHGDVHVKTKPTRWTDVFHVIPTLCFAYQCHVSIVPCYACLEPRKLSVFTGSSLLAVAVTFIVYSLVGIFGYLTFGTGVQPDILSSLSVGRPVVAFGFFMFALKAFLSYPIVEFCGRAALESLWVDWKNLDSLEIIIGERRRRIVCGTLWFVSSLLIGIFIPSIQSVIDILGSLAATFIFIYPGLCLLSISQIFEDQLPPKYLKLARIVSVFYITLGAFVFGLTLVMAIQYNLIGGDQPPPKALCR